MIPYYQSKGHGFDSQQCHKIEVNFFPNFQLAKVSNWITSWCDDERPGTAFVVYHAAYICTFILSPLNRMVVQKEGLILRLFLFFNKHYYVLILFVLLRRTHIVHVLEHVLEDFLKFFFYFYIFDRRRRSI